MATATTNLLIDYMAVNQASKEVTFNSALDILDSATGLIPHPTVSVGAISGGSIPVTIQMVNPIGTNLAETLSCLVILADAVNGGPSGTAPTAWTASTGVKLVDYTARVLGEFMTSSAGALVISVTGIAAHTYYMGVKVGSRVYWSTALVF